jgi:hypothetical protein
MSHQNSMDRRQFLQLSLMASAMLLASERGLNAIDLPSKTQTFGALQPLPPGAVQPEGWLRVYMEKQAAQLGSQLPNVSWPFTQTFWDGEDTAHTLSKSEQNSYWDAWWPYEQKGYWLDGATRLAIVLQDEHLMQQVRTSLDYTLAHADANGYLGPKFMEDKKDGCSRWPQNVFFRALAADADGQPSRQQQIAEEMRKHYLNDKAPYGKPVRNVTNIEAMLWCYGRTGDPRLLQMAETTWRDFMTVAGEADHGDLTWLRVYENTPIDSHGCTYAEESKLPAILYIHTGKPEYLRFALAAQRRVIDHHMLIDGIPSTSEWYRTTTSLDSHETCDISDHTWSWGYLMMATGDGAWGDRIERACFNAGPGAIKNDWKALQYFSCPNQFLATFNSNHNIGDHGGRFMAYQPNPGQQTACCAGNVHRLLPNYAIRMWMQGTDGGLTATLYGPSKVNATVGANREPVEIVQTTNYPFEEQIQFTINAKRAVRFPLSLRIPAWCSDPKIEVDGKTVSVSPSKTGFVTLDHRFKPGQTVTLTLPMKLAVSQWPENGVGIERGPLVYSLPIKEDWESVVEPKYTTKEFPGWQATPASAWNYGVALNSDDLASQIQMRRKPVGVDPWSDPPITLAVPAKKIEDWVLLANPENPGQRFTPALPDMGRSKVSETVEMISLVPYGSTKLRVTIFPAIKKA